MEEVVAHFKVVTGQSAIFVQDTLEQFLKKPLPGIEILAEMYQWFSKTDFTQRNVWSQEIASIIVLSSASTTLSTSPTLPIPTVLTFKQWLMKNYDSLFAPLIPKG
jgi:hypothetical protein